MIEVLKVEISPDGMKTIRLMSNRSETDARLLKLVPGAAREWAKIVRESNEMLSLHNITITYPLREMVDVRAACADGRARRLAVWKLVPEEEYRVREIIGFLVGWYFVQTHRHPEFAFMKKLPAGVEDDLDVCGVALREAEWAMTGCVMVGG
jgi:hypothetical protein